MDCIIFCAKSHPRFIYTKCLIFSDLLGLDCTFTLDVDVFRNSSFLKINYSKILIKEADFCIPVCSLLFEDGIRPHPMKTGEALGLPYLFGMAAENTDLPFDLMAMCFYLVSRYEEYLPFKADTHKRFSADQSVAARVGFLQIPLIDLWVAKLGEILKAKFPGLHLKQKKYRFCPGYDIDYAWAFLHRGGIRKWGSRLKKIIKGQMAALRQEQAVLSGKLSDPYDNFSYMDEVHQKFGLNPRYFFLVADYGKFDQNHAYSNIYFQKLIKNIAKKYPIGIHPSYFTTESPQKLVVEKKRLETIVEDEVYHSRQHFLRISFPQTYEQLIKAGIKEDFSLGYADAIGFRASIAQPFFWYNLRTEEQTNLLLHPIQVMDVTLNKYLQLDPQEAVQQTRFIIEQCKIVGGQFQCLWHNSSFGEQTPWVGWRRVYEEIVALAGSTP